MSQTQKNQFFKENYKLKYLRFKGTKQTKNRQNYRYKDVLQTQQQIVRENTSIELTLLKNTFVTILLISTHHKHTIM